jgi:hypothetical protein
LINECQRETECLRQRALYDESVRRQGLEEEIAQIQRNARCARRAAGLMAFLTAFAAAGLGYPTILLENFPSNVPPLIMNLIYALGVGSLISLLAFASLGMVYRKKLDQREKVRLQMVATLFESPLDLPDTRPLRFMPDSSVGDKNDGAAPIAAGANGSPVNMKSTAVR